MGRSGRQGQQPLLSGGPVGLNATACGGVYAAVPVTSELLDQGIHLGSLSAARRLTVPLARDESGTIRFRIAEGSPQAPESLALRRCAR